MEFKNWLKKTWKEWRGALPGIAIFLFFLSIIFLIGHFSTGVTEVTKVATHSCDLNGCGIADEKIGDGFLILGLLFVIYLFLTHDQDKE